MLAQPEVSIVIPTYNRSELLRNAVLSVLRQERDTTSTFEVIVVDNNSRDDTEGVVRSLINQYPRQLRYVFESNQGNAYARNTGIDNAKGAIIAFIDDDVIVDPNWLVALAETFKGREHLSFVGGKVLPLWNGSPPSWLTPDHWSPLALLDYGQSEMTIAGTNPPGLLTANIAFRRTIFDDVGKFSPSLQRVKDRIGSLEDHEFILRACRKGKTGIYSPMMIARAPVESERLTKTYHRRWHTGHGYFYAVLRDSEWERSKFRLLGVPSHLYRETGAHAMSWFSRMMRDADSAFIHECHLRFFRGFFLARLGEIFRSNRRGSSTTVGDSGQ
jgi:glucosyl-dolichyl phosphate glucuronosyltransferase